MTAGKLALRASGPWHPEAASFFTRYELNVPRVHKIPLNRLISRLVESGLWGKLRRLYVPVNVSTEEHPKLVNIKDRDSDLNYVCYETSTPLTDEQREELNAAVKEYLDHVEGG